MALLEVYPEMVRRTLEGPPVTDEEAQESGFFQEYLSQMHSLTMDRHFPEKYRRHYLKKYREYEGHTRSIAKDGIKNPLNLVRKGGRLYLWAGWKRLITAQVLGMEEVEVEILDG